MCNVMNSWFASVQGSNTVLTEKDCIEILENVDDEKDRVKVIEVLSENIPSFTVSDVLKYLRMVEEEHQMKVVAICSPKLVYALPFDCEPLYCAFYEYEAKVKVRAMITSQRSNLSDLSNQDVTPVYPSVKMLFNALNGGSDSFGLVELESKELVNVLNSWLASVPNPSFTFEEVVKLLEHFQNDAEDEVKQGNRLKVLQLVHNLMESPLSVDQVKELLNLYTNHQRRLDALLIVVEKMVFQTLWQLVGIIRMFETSTHRNKVRSVLESVKCNQQPVDQPDQPQKVPESVEQSEMLPYLISLFYLPRVGENELFSSLASHISHISELSLSSESLTIVLSFFSVSHEKLKVMELLSGYTQSVAINDLKHILNGFGHAAIDDKQRVVEMCAEKLFYDHYSECETLCEHHFYPYAEKAKQVLESHNHTVPGLRKTVPNPTMNELLEAIEEAVSNDERLSILRSWAASVPNPVICVNDYEKLLKHFPTDRDTTKTSYCPFNSGHLGGSSNRKIANIGRYLLGVRNLLFTPWDLAVFASYITSLERKMTFIELCTPLLEYDHPSQCEVIYKCIAGDDNKALAKKLVDDASKDVTPLKAFVDNWNKDENQFDCINTRDLRFEFLEITEDQFWAWLKNFHFDDMRDRAYRILVKKIVPPPSWAEELMPDEWPNNKRYLVLEYVPGGALVSDSSITCQPLHVSYAWVYFRDLINALDYLHELNIVHRDIKPSNLLLTADGHVKLSDFGVSIDITSNNRSSFALTGSSAFLAPELVSGYMDRAGKASDVWAAGVTLYFVLFGRLPFYDQQVMVVYRKICQDEPVFPQFIDPLLLNLLLSIFDKNPKTRITANELMTHPWIIHGPYNDSITVTDPEVVGEREKLLNGPTPSLQPDSSVHSLLEKAFAPLSIETLSSSRSPSAFDEDDRKSPLEKFDLYDCLSARSIAFVSDVDWTDGESVGDFDSDFNLDV
ncbi:hypothetical protein GEMRC1_005836 [Eukaryota sp. GEM-RC1]